MGYRRQPPGQGRSRISAVLTTAVPVICLAMAAILAVPAIAAADDGAMMDPVYAFSDRYPVEITVLNAADAREVAAMKISVGRVRLPDGPHMPGVVNAYVNDREAQEVAQAGFTVRRIRNEGKEAHAEVYRYWVENGLLDDQPSPEPGMRYDNWYSFTQLQAELLQLAADNPDLVSIQSIGTSVQGRNLWMLKVSSNVSVKEAEPEFKYTSTMHGDEVTGCEMIRRMLHYLVDNYGTDPRVTNLLDSTELWFMPLHNPDGFVAGSRFNANGVDINRNFPDPVTDPYDNPAGRQPETQAMMYFATDHNFVLGGNMHGGALVMNFPWDCRLAHTPDHDLFMHISLEYSYLNPPMWNSPHFPNGVTHGGEWYVVHGGMQDWSYEWRKELHITMELSNTKWPPWNQMDTFWNNNREAMLKMMEQVLEGVHGVVTDAVTGEPLRATVNVLETGREIFSGVEHGDYYRLLLPGTYTLTFDAQGYEPQTIGGIVVIDDQKTILDVALQPLPSYALYGTVTKAGTGAPLYATVEVWDHASGAFIDSQATDPATGAYSFASLPSSTVYDVRARALLHVPEQETITLTGDTELNFQLEESSGSVLVVRDGVTTRIASDLQDLGYEVTQQNASATDPQTWPEYGVVVWSAGNNTNPVSNASYRAALEAHVAAGGRLLIEGGEIGWRAATNPGYPSFAANVLHIDAWLADNAGGLQLHTAGHPLANAPNALPSSLAISYSSWGDEDAVVSTSSATMVYRTAGYPSAAGVITYDDDAIAEDGQIVYYAFNYNAVTDQSAAKDLLENSIYYLTSQGVVSVQDGASVARLALSGPVPNPVAGAGVRMILSLPEAVTVDASIYDVTGRRVQVLRGGGLLDAGSHEIAWDGRTGGGLPAGSGVYWVRVSAGEEILTRQVAVVR